MKRHIAFLLGIALTVSISLTARAQTKITLYSFTGGTDGNAPLGGLVFDRAGNLYGTTFWGGTLSAGFCGIFGCGTVFQLMPVGSAWDFRTVYRFKGEPADLSFPFARLTFDSQGNLYGTGSGGPNPCFTSNCGGVFKLSASQGWAESAIYFFSSNTGDSPGSGLTPFKGNFYGVTSFGPETQQEKVGLGTVYELTPSTGGTWKHSTIHAFHFGLDGYDPRSDLAVDQQGRLYGATPTGGVNLAGDEFELSRNGHGGWTSKVIHSEPANHPTSQAFVHAPNLIVGPDGNLYGPSTVGSGTCSEGCGSIVELKRTATGWKQITLYAFKDETDGSNPGTVLFDKEGNIYGSTMLGGIESCPYPDGSIVGCGTVFKLTKIGGQWQKRTLYSFAGGSDGEFPNGGQLVMDSSGNLYGATQGGAPFNSIGFGTIYEIQQ